MVLQPLSSFAESTKSCKLRRESGRLQASVDDACAKQRREGAEDSKLTSLKSR